MREVLVLGASGQVAHWVIEMLADKKDAGLTLFLRHPKRLKSGAPKHSRVVQGDVLKWSN